MTYFDPAFPNGFYSNSGDINFRFTYDEQDAKSILKQLKKQNIKYDKFLSCSVNQLATHVLLTELNKLQQIIPERININVSRTIIEDLFNHKKALEIFKSSLFEINFLDLKTLKRLESFITKINIFEQFDNKVSLTISKIKELAKEHTKINKKNEFNEVKNELYCKLLGLKIFITSTIYLFKDYHKVLLEKREEDLKRYDIQYNNFNIIKNYFVLNRLNKDAINSFLRSTLSNPILLNHQNSTGIQSISKQLLKGDYNSKINYIDQIIQSTHKEYNEVKNKFRQIGDMNIEIINFLLLNYSEINLVINNFHNEFILYNIKKIILDLGKNNTFRQKKFGDLKIETTMLCKEDRYNDLINSMIRLTKFDDCDDLFKKCIKAVDNFTKDTLSQDFPEFSILKADNNRKKSTTKKQVIEFDDGSDIKKIDSKDSTELLEVKQEVKRPNKDISLDTVETSLVNIIKRSKEEDASFSIIHEFDYLFRLKADSIYAKEANVLGHFKACDLRLFIDALLKTDLEALGTIIPMLFLNLAAQTEQKSKSSKVFIEEDIAHSHSLKELLEATGKLDQYDEKFKSYINDFNFALIWMRYLEHSSDMYKNSITKPQSLKWAEECMQLMQQIRKKRVQLDTNLRKKLLQLVDFVFESNIQSYVLLSEGRKELTLLLNHWREYLGVIKNQIIESLNSKKNQYIECKPLEKNHPIMLLEKMMQKDKDDSLNLKEALQHLYRLEMNKKLMSKYNDPVLNPWFERNLLSPWAIEALLKFMINKKGYTDHLSTHDFDTLIECFEQLNAGDKPIIFKNRDKLSEFDIGIAHHYPLSFSNTLEEKQRLFKDYLDMIFSFPQYITLTQKEKKRNRTDAERLIRALNLSQEVIKDIVDNCVQINK